MLSSFTMNQVGKTAQLSQYALPLILNAEKPKYTEIVRLISTCDNKTICQVFFQEQVLYTACGVCVLLESSGSSQIEIRGTVVFENLDAPNYLCSADSGRRVANE